MGLAPASLPRLYPPAKDLVGFCMKKEVIYPAARAAVTGLFACLLAAIVWGWSVAALVGAGVAFAAWLVFQLPKVQPVALSKSVPGTQFPTTTKIQIVGDSSSFQAGRWLDLPMSQNTIRQVAKRLAAGGTFGYASLAGPGKPLTRGEFENLRDKFINRNLAYWRDPKHHSQGCELTKSGQAVIRYFLPQNGHDTSIDVSQPEAGQANKRESPRTISQ